MKNHIKYVPISTFAAAIVLGGSVSAAENSPFARTTSNQQNQSQVNDRSMDSSNSYRLNARPLAADDVLGMNIDTTAGEKIGEIDEIFVNSDTGEVIAIVVSTGGFLDMGDQKTLISPRDLSFNNDRTSLEADLSKDQIRTAPRHVKGDTSGLDQVRPLTASGQDWEAQNERENQSSTYSQNQNDSNRSTSMSDEGKRRQQGSAGQPERGEFTESSDTNQDWAEHREGLTNVRTQSQNQTTGDRSSSKEADNELFQQGSMSQSFTQAIAISDLNDMELENNQGEDVGEVEEVFLDLDNQKVAGIVVSSGGIMGMGERETLFSLRELSFNGLGEAIVVNYNKDEIDGFPDFNAEDPAAFSDLDKRTNRLPANNNRSMSSANARTDANRNAYGRSNNDASESVSDRSSYGANSNNQRSNADREQYGLNSSENAGTHNERRNADNSSDMTVFNQGNSSGEMAMTASIREAIREDKSLSSRANNLTIVTKDEKVMLRGSVDSASEKSSVEEIARNKAGRQNVTSEITVNSRLGRLSQ